MFKIAEELMKRINEAVAMNQPALATGKGMNILNLCSGCSAQCSMNCSGKCGGNCQGNCSGTCHRSSR